MYWLLDISRTGRIADFVFFICHLCNRKGHIATECLSIENKKKMKDNANNNIETAEETDQS